jgi:hypothetical protein
VIWRLEPSHGATAPTSALIAADCKNFLSSPEKWAERAVQLRWDAMALFGCAPERPLDYSGSAGLLWAINGGRLVELHREWAVIDLAVNRSQRIFDHRKLHPAKMTLPWAKLTISRLSRTRRGAS